MYCSHGSASGMYDSWVNPGAALALHRSVALRPQAPTHSTVRVCAPTPHMLLHSDHSVRAIHRALGRVKLTYWVGPKTNVASASPDGSLTPASCRARLSSSMKLPAARPLMLSFRDEKLTSSVGWSTTSKNSPCDVVRRRAGTARPQSEVRSFCPFRKICPWSRPKVLPIELLSAASPPALLAHSAVRPDWDSLVAIVISMRNVSTTSSVSAWLEGTHINGSSSK
mmetsp:Transcript_47648/g.136286  ORF Transcript_47648/g.136286 Transcript_47648/m.136286 type:complete len:225 (+) Transcript_47648:1964-2638(+)